MDGGKPNNDVLNLCRRYIHASVNIAVLTKYYAYIAGSTIISTVCKYPPAIMQDGDRPDL